LLRPQTIFATNTSGLSPTAIAEAIERKDKFVVAHFWNPPHLMPLVEVVPAKHTSQETVDITWQLMEKIGKKPVALKREALGFIGNRLQLALLREALYIVESGIATQEAVDTTVKYSLGRRLSVTGPLESADLGGLDIFYNISNYLMADLCNDIGVSSLLKDAVE
jgi:3-hydroxybutyryl-CoA dehydrogenase